MSPAKEITSFRQAASVCGVSPFVLRTWIHRGLLDEPPWTLEQLHAVHDAQNRGPRIQAPHGTTARWNNGCGCATCRRAHNDLARTRKRANAQKRLPTAVRQQLLDVIYEAGHSVPRSVTFA
jgi:hypothetical protein